MKKIHAVISTPVMTKLGQMTPSWVDFFSRAEKRLNFSPARGSTASRPKLDASDIGTMYFDTTLAIAGKPIWWAGSVWVDAMGSVV